MIGVIVKGGTVRTLGVSLALSGAVWIGGLRWLVLPLMAAATSADHATRAGTNR